MSYLEICGGRPLDGELEIQGSKNAVLPVLAACVPGEGACTIENCPDITDVTDTLNILRALGYRAERTGGTVRIEASGSEKYEICGPEAVRIRSSVLFLGALLGKMKKARLPLPGGCVIGARPIDLHLRALRALGAEFSLTEKITAEAPRLHGGTVRLPFPSVGATENAILAAVTAEGHTVIEGAAREPEIDELCAFLRLRGADIRRLADGSIDIQGVRRLGPASYRMRPDRIVAGTYLLAAAAAGGKVFLQGCGGEGLEALEQALRAMGAVWRKTDGGLEVCAAGRLRAIPYLETAPHPGFPTDLQSQLMAALCRARGSSRIRETVFENRFRVVSELRKMGARIEVNGDCARIEGVSQLRPAVLEAADLRGGAGLAIAALQAPGRSAVLHTEYLARGYEDIGRDLRLLGAQARIRGIRCTDETKEKEEYSELQRCL